MVELLSVAEVATFMRTTTTTVYRWLRTGRIKGLKIGKEWRISAAELSCPERLTPTARQSPPSVWDTQADGGHIMAVCSSRDEVFMVEAGFFNTAASRNMHILKGCWWQDPAELADRYTQAGCDFTGMRQDGLLRVADFNESYELYGPSGPVGIWQREIQARGTARLWACGSPAPDCFGAAGPEAMLSFELLLDQALDSDEVVGLCTYSFDDLAPGGLSLIQQLIDRHSALMVFDDGQGSVLQKLST